VRLEASPTRINMGGERRKLKAKGKPPLPPVNHQERIPDLRAKYQECMERPEYWWIQDEVIATIGKALEQRNFVVSDDLDICRALPRHTRLLLVLEVANPNPTRNPVFAHRWWTASWASQFARSFEPRWVATPPCCDVPGMPGLQMPASPRTCNLRAVLKKRPVSWSS